MSDTVTGAAMAGRNEKFTVTVWGVRGSTPLCGGEFARYGGNTTCIEMRCGGEVLIFDAGTGIVTAGKRLVGEAVGEIHLFLTHSHYDHVQGLPFFAPLYKPHTRACIASGHLEGRMSTRDVLTQLMRPPLFPIDPGYLKADIRYLDFRPGDRLEPAPGIAIETARLNHPGGAVGYRVTFAGKSVAIVTDTEHVPGELDANVLRLIENTDLFLYDASYGDEEMGKYAGFGHSSWQQAIRLASVAKARHIGLIHHSFFHTDSDLDRIGELARARFDRVDVVRDGQVFDI